MFSTFNWSILHIYTSILLMSMDRTVTNRTIWRKKSDSRQTMANRQNSCKRNHEGCDHSTLSPTHAWPNHPPDNLPRNSCLLTLKSLASKQFTPRQFTALSKCAGSWQFCRLQSISCRLLHIGLHYEPSSRQGGLVIAAYYSFYVVYGYKTFWQGCIHPYKPQTSPPSPVPSSSSHPLCSNTGNNSQL